jgi:hypothetical protein
VCVSDNAHEKTSYGLCTEEGLSLRPVSLPIAAASPYRETTLPGMSRLARANGLLLMLFDRIAIVHQTVKIWI